MKKQAISEDLDDATLAAFQEIRQKGFEPTLYYHPFFVGLWYRSKSQYSVILKATNPELTFDNMGSTSTARDVASLIPTHNGGIPIIGVEVLDYNGRAVYGAGYPCRERKSA